MANMNLVTGFAGEAHVSAADVGALNAGIVGAGQYVLNYGNKLAATVVTNNQIRVQDGVLLMQGRQIRIDTGTYVDLTVDNGATGYNRNDLIVARYTKDASTGVEAANLVVIKGTPATSAADPAYGKGDIASGATANEMPLYRIRIENLNVVELEPLFEVAESTKDHAANKSNPHNVTAAQVGAAAANHTHALTGLSGTLGVSQGGTGATTQAAALTNLGAAPSGHNHTLDSMSNIHIVSSMPSSFVNGHWYLVRES